MGIFPGMIQASGYVRPVKAGHAVGLLGATSGVLQLQPPAAITDYSATLPDAQGGSGTTLVNNGSGVLSWGDHGALGGRTDDDHSIYALLAPASSARNVFTSTAVGVRTFALQSLASQTAALLEVLRSDGSTVDHQWKPTTVGESSPVTGFCRYIGRLAGGKIDQGGGANLVNAAAIWTADPSAPTYANSALALFSAGGRGNGPVAASASLLVRSILRVGFSQTYPTQDPMTSTGGWDAPGVIIKPPNDASSALEVLRNSATQSESILRVMAHDRSSVLWQINKGGYEILSLTSALADGDLSANQVSRYFDATNDAAAVTFKGKQNNGSVVYGRVKVGAVHSFALQQDATDPDVCRISLAAYDVAGHAAVTTCRCYVWFADDDMTPLVFSSVEFSTTSYQWRDENTPAGVFLVDVVAGALQMNITDALHTTYRVYFWFPENDVIGYIDADQYGSI